MNQLRQLLAELYRKKIIIVLCAVLCAAALAFEKYYFGEFVVRTGTYYTTAVVHVDHLKENDNSLKAERLLRTTGNLYSFIEKNEKINLSHASLADVWRNNPNIFSVFDNISYSYCLLYTSPSPRDS